MSITDEMREWFISKHWFGWGFEHTIEEMLDRIDAEYENAITSVMNDALYHANEKDMAELGWTRLPKDADGELWHIGDRDEDGETVTAIKLGLDGFWIRVGCTYRIAKQARHYHAPTVEDVLREFADIVRKERVELATISEDTIAEYAKRLTLAGDAE